MSKRTWIKTDRSKEEYWEPVTERYARVIAIVFTDGKAAEKHREELFGTATQYSYPDAYNTISLGRELVGDYLRFSEMLKDPNQVRTVAKMIAQYRLDKMVELVSRHESIMKRNEESQKQKALNAQKSKGRRH